MNQLQVTGAATFSSSVTAQGGATIFSTTSDLQLLIGNGSRDMFISGATASGTSQMIGIQNISGANRVNLYDGKLVITSAGNVGIGTSSPSSLLTVAGATDLAWSAGTSKLQILRSGSQARINNYESGSGSSIAIAWDGGNVLIGTTTDNGARLQINGTSNFTGNLTINDGSLIKLGQGGSSNVSIDFFASNFGAGYEGRIMGLNSDGNTHFYHRNGSATFTDIGYFNNTGMYITYYGTYSDMRLKDVIETNPNIDLDAIDVIKYTLKSNPTLVRYGYSAQQVQSVLPDLVTLNTRIDGNNEDATLMLNYNDLYVLKIAALEKKLKELTEEVAKLK